MPSDNYRYYCLDGTGHLHGTEWFSAASDEDAIAHVKAKHPDGQCEIWQGQRLVAQLGFAAQDDLIRQSYRSIADSRSVLRDTASIVSRRLPPDSSGDAR
jgi:hypothetical protein